MAGERTENPYRTYGPADTGESWHEYFKRVLMDSGNGRDDDDSGDDEQPTGGVLLVSGGLEHYDVPGPVKQLLARLTKNGFRTNSGYASKFFEGGVYGPTAQKAGEKKPDRTIDTVWVEAISEDHSRLVRFAYQKINDGKFTCTWRQLNKQLKPVGDKEMKEFIDAAE